MNINRRRLAISVLSHLQTPNPPKRTVFYEDGVAIDEEDDELFHNRLEDAFKKAEESISKHTYEFEKLADDLDDQYASQLDLRQTLSFEEWGGIPEAPQVPDISREVISRISEEMDELAGRMRRAVIYAATYEEPRISQAELARIAGVSHVTIGRWLANKDDVKRVRRTVYERATDLVDNARTDTLDELASRATVARLAQRCEDAADPDPLSSLTYVSVALSFFIAETARNTLSNWQIVAAISKWIDGDKPETSTTSTSDPETLALLERAFPQEEELVHLWLPRHIHDQLRETARARGVEEADAIKEAIIARLRKKTPKHAPPTTAP